MDIPDAPDTQGFCGDGLIQEGETCDGLNVGDHTCESLGLGSGTLVCNTTCNGFLKAACAPITCGNGQLDKDMGELCDGDQLDDKTCESFGYYPGTLAC